MTGPKTTRKAMIYDKRKIFANALRVVTKNHHYELRSVSVPEDNMEYLKIWLLSSPMGS
jgi:hypothetical protein